VGYKCRNKSGGTSVFKSQSQIKRHSHDFIFQVWKSGYPQNNIKLYFFLGFVFRFFWKISFSQAELQPETSSTQQLDLLVLPGKTHASSVWLNGSAFSISFWEVNEKKLQLKVECNHGEKGYSASRECWPLWDLINLYRLECIRICPFFDIVLET